MASVYYQNIETGQAADITTAITAASWKTKRAGSPAQLDFTLAPGAGVELINGGVVTLCKGAGLFRGYIFKISKNEKGEQSATAYDQIRYLKNKDTYVFQGKTATQITAQIANDFGIALGALENTGYVIPTMVEDSQTLLDIILKALDYTLINTGKLFYLWDDCGRLRLSDVAKDTLTLMIGDSSLATAYTWESSIDNDTANKIKLVRDNKETGRREVYIVQDSGTMGQWGVLQHYAKVAQELNPAQIEAQADTLLALKNRPKTSFSLAALGDLSVRAGRSLFIRIGDIPVNGRYICDEVTHDLLKETMTIKVVLV